MSKAKSSFKGFVFLLLIIAIIGGVVAAIIFWPQKPEDIKNSLNNQTSSVLNNDGDLFKNLKNYGEYTIDYRAKNDEINYSYSSVLKIYSSLSIYFDYMSYTFEDADFSNYEISDIKNAQYGINDATAKVTEVSSFLKAKNDTLAADGFNTKVYSDTEAKLVWENVEEEILVSFENYYKATSYLAKVYKSNIKKGMYANDFAKVTIDGVGYYLNYFSTSKDKLGTSAYHSMTVDFSNFVENYLAKEENSQRLVASYLTSENLQKNTETLVKFEELVEKENYTLETLLLNEISFNDEEFTAEQTGHLIVGIKFFKGELAL